VSADKGVEAEARKIKEARFTINRAKRVERLKQVGAANLQRAYYSGSLNEHQKADIEAAWGGKVPEMGASAASEWVPTTAPSTVPAHDPDVAKIEAEEARLGRAMTLDEINAFLARGG
jgi:hypothetical protein